MSYQVDNAIIMAAGTSSRFAPLSFEMPKGLIPVKGEVLIERQIRQLREAGIDEIILVVGYKKEEFAYLQDKYGVIMVENPWYETRNNNGSIYVAREYLHNSYICSSDNYFNINPFEKVVDDSYYAALYANGQTAEWCMHTDEQGYINQVQIGGENAWYMLGHTFWNEEFSRTFCRILEEEFDLPETKDKLWEKIFMSHLDELKMKVRQYADTDIFEFDTLDELRQFDESYHDNTRSHIIKALTNALHCHEREITDLKAVKTVDNTASGFTFVVHQNTYQFDYETRKYRRV